MLPGALVALVAVAACGGGGSDPAAPGGGEGGDAVEVVLTDFAFTPATVTVAAGTTVRWRNATSMTHTVTPEEGTPWAEWTTSVKEETFEVTFATPGTYDYYCRPHRSLGMVGRVVVQ